MKILIALSIVTIILCFVGYREIVRGLNLSAKQKTMAVLTVISIPILGITAGYIVTNLFQK